MSDQDRLNVANQTEANVPPDPDLQHRISLLGQLVRRYAWCQVQSDWPEAELPDYLLVVELPDGRRYWRYLSYCSCTPDATMLRWATCPPKKWMSQFRRHGKGSQRWNEFFDFWAKP